MINITEYLMGRDRKYTLRDEYRTNAAETVDKVNQLLESFGESRKVVSGWRPAEINAATPNAALHSKHMTCEACDLSDPDGDLDEWALEHPEVLQEIGLWQEHPASTKGWAHFQVVPPKSGNRCFYP